MCMYIYFYIYKWDLRFYMFKSSAFHLKSFKIVQLYPNEGTPCRV